MTHRSKQKMFVYVAGPMTTERSYQWVQNCLAPAELVYKLKLAGAAVYCPLFEGLLYQHDIPYDIAIEECSAWLSLCDAICFPRGWSESKGCCYEYKYALQNGVQVYTEDNIDELFEELERIRGANDNR